MMNDPNRILVVQTAFIGDAVLTLPLIQVLKKFFPKAGIDVVAVPRSAELFRNHPDISQIVEYDKRGKHGGVGGFRNISAVLRQNSYDLAIVPHRSLRSALLARVAGAPFRVGFDSSAGWFLFSKTVKYRPDIHEIGRNLSLLEGIGRKFEGRELPRVYPSGRDEAEVSRFLSQLKIADSRGIVAIAPGTIWNTKRWLKERFAELSQTVIQAGYCVILVGGPEDQKLCDEIAKSVESPMAINSSGKFTLLESAELLKRCKALVSNDSAPMHLAVAMGTPVVAIFGATVPAFGFAPYGERDFVVEASGLSCRPCSIHGGDECPIGTFDCMKRISSDLVFGHLKGFL